MAEEKANNIKVIFVVLGLLVFLLSVFLPSLPKTITDIITLSQKQRYIVAAISLLSVIIILFVSSSKKEETTKDKKDKKNNKKEDD